MEKISKGMDVGKLLTTTNTMLQLEVKNEYSRLVEEDKKFRKEHPVASQRSKEENAQIQKIRDRMKKLSKHMDMWKQNSKSVGKKNKRSNENKAPKEKRKQRTLMETIPEEQTVLEENVAKEEDFNILQVRVRPTAAADATKLNLSKTRFELKR